MQYKIHSSSAKYTRYMISEAYTLKISSQLDLIQNCRLILSFSDIITGEFCGYRICKTVRAEACISVILPNRYSSGCPWPIKFITSAFTSILCRLIRKNWLQKSRDKANKCTNLPKTKRKDLFRFIFFLTGLSSVDVQRHRRRFLFLHGRFSSSSSVSDTGSSVLVSRKILFRL